MVTLSEESANGTYQDDVDRENLQAEMDALKEEINRIADSANFNGIQLLDGSMSKTTVVSAAQAVTVTGVAAGAHNGSAVAGEFTVDLTQLSITNKSSTKTGTISLTFGGQTVYTASDCQNAFAGVAISSTVSGGTLSGTAVAASYAGRFVKIDGAVYTITNKSGVLTLTGKTAPTATTQTPMTVAVTLGGGASSKLTSNQGNSLSVDVVKQPVSADANKLAQGKFTLTAAMLKDGNAITIGTTSYTIKVGSTSTVSGQNLIDLSKFDGTNNVNDMIQEAAKQIAAVDNSKFLVTTDDAKAGTTYIHLTERKDASIDYNKEWNLASSTTYANGDWRGVVSYGAIDNSKTTGGLTLQIGDTSDSWNQMNVSIDDMHTTSMGIDDISISTQADAAKAISVIKDAINYVSSTRGTLGATQNRLEHTANNLSVMTENIQDAESTIRDTDIADEMTAYTKNQILVQSAQAMLAQANSVPQGVLQLLQ
jgi:flagellin